MALFDDGPINRTEDLAQYDSTVIDTAKAEGIDTCGKIAIAQSEIATDIVTFLQDRSIADPLFGWSGPSRRRMLGTSDVVVTSSLRRWHALKSLAEIYADAFGQQANNRYQWKWSQFEDLVREARAACMAAGIGLVGAPLPKANTPDVSVVAGTGAPATVYFWVAFVNAEGEEGCASDPVLVAMAAATQAQVGPGLAPLNATGWNVYAGDAPNAPAKQNTVPLNVTASWLQPAALAPGSAPATGQVARFYVVGNREIRRG